MSFMANFIADQNNNQVPDGVELLNENAEYLHKKLLPNLTAVLTATSALVLAFVTLVPNAKTFIT